MKRKQPFIVILGLSTFIILSIYRFFEYKVQLEDDFQEYQLYREEKILAYSEIGVQLVQQEKLSELKKLLETARKTRDIDFYILQYQGSPLMLGAYGDHPEELDIEYQNHYQLMRGPHASTYTVPIGPDNILTIGINRSFENHFEYHLSREKISELQIVIGPMLIFLILAAYFFNDIKKILSQLRNRGIRNFKNQPAKSIEAEILAGGLSGYNENQIQLEKKNRTLENQVLPSLKSEILSGLPPPYTFDCTLVRTDINNFTKIFNHYDTETFMEIINDFFTQLSHIIMRYDGLIHQFIGDEVIFYFKNKPNENSVLKALTALRDINEAAVRYHEYTSKTFGYAFTIKSSLASGKLRFGHLVSGYTLAGAVLIETVRVLSQITEKDENLICFNKLYTDNLDQICEYSNYAQVHLKGYQEEFSLVRYVKHNDIHNFLTNLRTQTNQALRYYRNDIDIIAIIKTLRKYSHELEEKTILDVIDILRQFKISHYKSKFIDHQPPQVAEELLLLLEALAPELLKSETIFIENIQSIPILPTQKNEKALSATCKLLQNLMTQAEFEHYFDSHLVRMLGHSNHRVVANFIDVIIYFNHEHSEQVLQRFFNHENVRIATNALVYEGSRKISAEITNRLEKNINSSNSNLVAAALYALGEIALQHREADPVYYRSQVELHRIIDKITKLKNSKNESIAKQAEIAARKCGLTSDSGKRAS